MPLHRRSLQAAGAGSLSWPLACIILAGLALRVARLDFQPLWWDEGYSVWFATHSLGQMAALTAQDIHPPLYYALLHGWTGLAGTGPVGLRLFSVAAGVLAIPAVYVAGRRMLGLRTAWLASLLWALNPLAVYYGQEVRMYGLVALLSAAIIAVAWPILRPDCPEEASGSSPVRNATALPGLRILAPYVLLTVAALYTQYYAVFLPLGLTLYATWRWRRHRAALARWLAAQAVAALLYLPWVVYATPNLVPYVSQKVVADGDHPLALAPYVAQHLAAFLAGHLETPLASYAFAALVLLVPVLLGLVWLAQDAGPAAARSLPERGELPSAGQPLSPVRALSFAEGRPAAYKSSPALAPLTLLATVLLTALALGYAISRRYPFFPQRGERLLLLALPPFLLLVAAGLDGLWRRARPAALVTLGLTGALALASLWGFYTVPRYPEDDYRPLLARIVEQGRPGDTVFAVYPWQVGYWRSYGDPHGPVAVLSPAPAWGPAVSQSLDAALARGHVWFPAHLALGAILETHVENYLAGRALAFFNQWYGPGTRLSGWSAPGGALPAAPVAPLTGQVTFAVPGGGGTGLTLEAAGGAGGPVPAANAVMPLALCWSAAAQPPALAASVRLIDDLGQIWAQHDYEPLGGPVPERAAAERQVTGSGPGVSSGKAFTPACPAGTGGWQAEDRLGLLVPAGTPPGRYRVAVSVRPQGGTRALEALDAAGQRHGEAVPLFELLVSPADQPASEPERLPVAERREINLGDRLRFLGYSRDDAAWAPGAPQQISLFWQALAQPIDDYTAFVQLLGRPGQPPVAAWEAPPGAAYPTGRWAPGTLMRTQAVLRPPATAPDGRYRLIAGLYRRSDGRRLSADGGNDYVDLGWVTVAGRPHAFTPPAPSHAAAADFQPLGRLIGYDLPNGIAIRPGGRAPLTLYWQAAGAGAEHPYTVFVHLVDAATGTLHGAGDGEPGGGRLPTTSWAPGEYLADEHLLAVDPGTPPGAYRLAVGLYDTATGQRLRQPDGSDQYILDTTVQVAP